MTEQELTIEAMVYGGAGIAHANNEPWLVPFTLPGEKILATRDSNAVRDSKTARLLQLIQSSPARTQPQCIHFTVCGGCQYQHTTYDEQLRIKQDILTHLLQRAGIAQLPALQTHAAEPWHYRNRVQFRAANLEGRMHLGYSMRGSNQFLPVQMCPITSQSIWHAAQSIQSAWNVSPLAAQPLREVELFVSDDEQQLQASFFLDVEHAHMDREAATQFRTLLTTLQTSLPQLQGAGLSVWAGAPNPRAKFRPTLQVVRWGSDALTYRVNDLAYLLHRGGFFQVNRLLLPQFVTLATARAHGQHAWDLYAGAGLFTQQLARTIPSVTAVEVGEQSAAALAQLAAQRRNIRAVRADTLKFLQQQAHTLHKPEFVLLDPPRAGLGLPVCDALLAHTPQTITYVSCDPTTLTRDLKRLIESGYCLVELHLVDLFPQTFHMETVAVLTR